MAQGAGVRMAVLKDLSVFSYYRMCSLTIECVLAGRGCSDGRAQGPVRELAVRARPDVFFYYRMCSLTIECVLLL